jgi:hypothetical protein
MWTDEYNNNYKLLPFSAKSDKILQPEFVKNQVKLG